MGENATEDQTWGTTVHVIQHHLTQAVACCID